MKIKCFILFLFAYVVASCQSNKNPINTPDLINESKIESTIQKDTSYFYYPWISNYDYNSSLINNISLPKDYQRIDSEKNSFAEWLRHLPLKIDNTVYLHSGEKKYNQTAQFRVLDIDVGTRDLQQCADAVMRLRAEYLFASNQMDKIHFNYTNGINIPFSKWSSGFYPSLKGNKVVWVSSLNNKSYKSFKKYINNVFMYAGTASLEKEMNQVELKNTKSGDVLIKGGFPGHAVIVIDVAINHSTNNKIFMLAQSYMPAQSIHVLRNDFSDLSPWYSINEIDEFINTPEWTFSVGELKRFKE